MMPSRFAGSGWSRHRMLSAQASRIFFRARNHFIDRRFVPHSVAAAWHPIKQLLHRHVTEAIFRIITLVARPSGRREVIIHTHIMDKREAELVPVTVAVDEQIEHVAHCPSMPVQLEEEVVHREIKSIDHPVLAFVHHPEQFALVPKKLGAAKIAVRGLRDEKFLIGVQFAFCKFPVALAPQAS